MNDPYYTPEKYGLRIVGDVDFSSGCYEFDLTVVWQDVATGDLYYADDAGCSCPSPFEAHGRDDLTLVKHPKELLDHLTERTNEVGSYGNDNAADDVAALLSKVQDARRVS
ncbi:DUF7574 domain-containing protein [Nocardia sp. NPDC001965]